MRLESLPPPARYAEGLRQWRGAKNWEARLRWRDERKGDPYADRFADPELGLTYYERRNLRQGFFGRNR